MLLRSLAVKNYRSLESVRLDKLERFNVLIGRNNAGKSTVVSALELLSNVLRGNPATQGNVLTFFDINRTLEIQLEFEPHPEDRTEFIGLLVAAHNREDRRDAMLKSPLLRRIEFSFKAPPGSPHMLHLRETRLRTEDNRWAVVQRMEGEENEGNPLSEVVSLGAMSAQFPTTPLDYALLDVANARGIMPGREEPLVQKLRIVYSPFQEHFHADPATTWPQRRLIKYLRDAFFFDPFRHSAEERLPAMHKTELAQNGSDLAQVLNTLSSNERSKFEEIESFVHNALPDIGNLEARLVPGTSETEVNFHYPMEDYRVPIHEMGGGIEQLLMVATVLLTTSQESTIFLEEPESHLHAGAQRFLIERLYAGNRQVFVTTHSPTFVNLPRSRSVY